MAGKKKSKVVYNGEVLMDLTSDSVDAQHLLRGYTAHGKDGEVVEGACTYDADTSDATAAASEVLNGKTGYVNGVKVTGTMANNGAVSGAISTKAGEYTIPAGYHDGSGKVGIDETEQGKIVAENIRQGINILGVEGSMTGTEDVNAEAKTVTPSATQQTVTPDTEGGYNYISQVTVNAIPYTETENAAGGLTVTIG